MALPKDGDFSKLLGAGENPNGFVCYTPNGTKLNGKPPTTDAPNWFPQYDGPRWSRGGGNIFPPTFAGSNLPRRAKPR